MSFDFCRHRYHTEVLFQTKIDNSENINYILNFEQEVAFS